MPTATHTPHLIDNMADELWNQFIAFKEAAPYNTAPLAEEHPKLVRELLELEEKFHKLFKLLAADPDLFYALALFVWKRDQDQLLKAPQPSEPTPPSPLLMIIL